MKKSFKLENLDCANCAAKMEAAINKLDEVEECTISFMTQRMNIVADDIDAVIPKAQECISKVDEECKIIVR